VIFRITIRSISLRPKRRPSQDAQKAARPLAKALKSNGKLVIFKKEQISIKEAQALITSKSYRRAAQVKWWLRYFSCFLIMFIIFIIAFSPYVILKEHYNHVALIAIPPLAIIFAVISGVKVSDPYHCTACGRNTVHAMRIPFYCRSCGMSFIFHRLSKWYYQKRL
jgi:predicted RNA-binding Zn-ribbon protein involved in translation (DUF1610 family)